MKSANHPAGTGWNNASYADHDWVFRGPDWVSTDPAMHDPVACRWDGMLQGPVEAW